MPDGDSARPLQWGYRRRRLMRVEVAMAKFKVRLYASVRGRDMQAEGVLEIRLPFRPFEHMAINDIYTAEPLIVDSVSYGMHSGEFGVWTQQIREDRRKCMTLIKRFVGDWEWDVCSLPDESGEETEAEAEEPPVAKRDRPEIPERTYTDIAEILTRRGGALPPQASPGAESGKENEQESGK